MERSPPWHQRIARRLESWIGLAALAGSAWMFSTMSEATTVAAQGVVSPARAEAAPRANAAPAHPSSGGVAPAPSPGR